MIEFLLLSKTGDFFGDLILPAIAGAFVLALIFNSLLNKFGYTLW